MDVNPIKQSLIAISKDTQGFYNGRRALIPGFDRAMVSWIVGQRRIGKTQFFIHLMCHAYQEHGVTTLWLRNKVVELEELGNGFLYDAKRLGWCPDEWEVRADGVYTGSGKDASQVCWFKAISTFSNARGSSYPCNIVVFDEFMPEDRRYPHGCATGLISLVKTVVSNRPEARVYCLSNSISAVNPYFARYRIFPKDVVTWYDDKAMLIEKCVGYQQANMSDANPWLKVYKATGYSEYADEKDDARWELIVRTVPKGAKPTDWLLQSNGFVYRAWIWNGIYYFAEYKGKRSGTYMITSERENVNTQCLYMSPDFKNSLMQLFDTGGARFVGANTMFDVLNSVFEYGL